MRVVGGLIRQALVLCSFLCLKITFGEVVSCDSEKGLCIDTDTEVCDGILKTGYCPGDSSIMCCEPESTLPGRCLGSGPSLENSTYEFTLENQGFPGHPGALVYLPSRFDAKSETLEVVVYVHGYNNCIRNIVRAPEDACNCSAGQDIRQAYGLIRQFEDATINNSAASNWIFVAAEVAYDQANDSPGRWAEEGLFKGFLNELLSVHMKPIIGYHDINSVSRIRIFSHSGGYYVIGNMAIVGGADQVRDLSLLDSLYANFDQFDQFVQENLLEFGTAYNQYRFTSIYTATGGTFQNNQEMAKRAESWVQSANVSDIYILDNTAEELSVKTIQEKSLIYKFTDLSHDDVPRNLFYTLLVGAV